MSHCIFCSIANGTEPASIVYQDNNFMVIMDAYPLSKGHCLVIPTKHAIRLDDLDENGRTRLFELGYQVVESQKKNDLGVHGTNILINDGEAANQTVPHLHLHLIPRSKGDLLRSIPRIALHVSGLFGFRVNRAQLDQLAANLRGQL